MTTAHIRFTSILSVVLLATNLQAQTQNALDLDGTDDQVSVSNASALIAGASGFSMTCWVKPTAGAEHQGIVGFRDEVGADFYLLKLANLNTIEARMRTSGGAFYTLTTPGLILDTWQHLALVYDGSELVLYRNGVQVSSVAANGVISSTTGTFRLGNLIYAGDDFTFDGQLDEVSLWNTALSDAEVQCMASSPINGNATDLQLYFAMDQGVAGGNNAAITTLTDLAGNSDGVLQGFAMTGATSNFVTGAALGYAVDAFLCAGESYLFNGEALTTPGVYTATFPTAGLCDSTVVLHLVEAEVDNGVVQNGPTLIATAAGASYQWYTCAPTGNTPITGATGQYYQATAVGQYAVEVTQNGCSAMSICHNVTSIGIEERMTPLVSVSPSPVVDLLTVELDRTPLNASITVVDMTGRTVLQRSVGGSRRYRLDVSALTPGAYFLRLAVDGASRVVRFVRE